MKEFPVAAAVLLASMPAVARAEDNSSSLGQVVITPSLMAQPVLDAISSVTVIDRADILRPQSRSVTDLLQGAAEFGLYQWLGSRAEPQRSLRHVPESHT